MTSFLSSLIERAESRAPALERRPRGLFEPTNLEAQALPPVMEPADEPMGSALDRERPQPAMQAAYVASRMPRPVSEPAIPLEPARALRATRVAEPEDVAAPAPERIEQPLASPPVREPERRRDEPALVHVESRTALLRPEPITTVVREVVTPPVTTSQAMASQRTVQSPEAPVVSQLRAPQQTHSPDPTPRARPTTASAATPPTAPTLQPRIARESSAAALFAQAQRPSVVAPSPAAPPAIHISIGRIEVRAHQATAEPARAAKPSEPRLKLDEYLRQRSRGGR